MILTAQKAMKCQVIRETGYLYFIDEEGDISRLKMARGGKKKAAAKKPVRKTVKKKTRNKYFFLAIGRITIKKPVERIKKKIKPATAASSNSRQSLYPKKHWNVLFEKLKI